MEQKKVAEICISFLKTEDYRYQLFCIVHFAQTNNVIVANMYQNLPGQIAQGYLSNLTVRLSALPVTYTCMMLHPSPTLQHWHSHQNSNQFKALSIL